MQGFKVSEFQGFKDKAKADWARIFETLKP
jgi:hypothetical protein